MTAVVAAPCRHCDAVHELTVNVEGFVSWQSGKYIQDALPELSAGERELLISGTCDECWQRFLPEEDE